MIVHIVMFKFKDEDKTSNVEKVRDMLNKLGEELPMVKFMEVGVDFDKTERAFDLSLYSKFNSKEDLKAYAVDEKHLEVVKFIKSVTTDVKVVDYTL